MCANHFAVRKRWLNLTLVGFAVIVGLRWYYPMGIERLVEIEGNLGPFPFALEEPRLELWFPERRILIDATGRYWYRDQCGHQSELAPPSGPFRIRLDPSGRASICIPLASWLPPGHCTLRLRSHNFLTRYARHLPLQGWGRHLKAEIPSLPPPVQRKDESEE